jgi:hypothetical protein
MSGGIAVLADDLGRRLGKKRLHVKGLRPKRVAQIGTALAGVVVSLLTIIVVAVASKGVRQWIQEGRLAIGERDRARQDLERIRQDRKAQEDRLIKAQDQSSRLTRQNDSLSKNVQRQTKQIDEQKNEIAVGNAQIRQLTPQIVALRRKVLFAEVEAKRRQKELETRKLALRQTEDELKRTAGDLRQKKSLLAEAIKQKSETDTDNLKLFSANRELEKKSDELKGRVASLQTQIAKLEADRDNASQALEDAKSELEVAQQDLINNRRELASVLSDLSEVQIQAIKFKQINDQSRNAPPMYLKGDEVARLSIEAGLSAAKAQSALQTLLRNARLSALGAGAKQNGVYPEAGIFSHIDRLTGRTLSPEDIQQEIVGKIAGAKEPMVLVAVSSLNSFQGEPVSLEIMWMANPVVYHRDEVVAETRLDGRKEPSAIVDGITALGDMVRERAKQDKMLPRATEGLRDSLGQSQVWRLLNDVKRSGGLVHLRAVAESDTRAGDPLRIRFVIR